MRILHHFEDSKYIFIIIDAFDMRSRQILLSVNPVSLFHHRKRSLLSLSVIWKNIDEYPK